MANPQSEHQLDFRFRILKEDLNGHAIVMDSCIFIWVGHARSDFLLFGFGDQCAFIDGMPTPNNQVFLQSMCTKLCRLFHGKQIYFSTDIGGGETKDPHYWLKFFEALKTHFDENKQFYRLE
ncbi:hypothetical protein M3Y97_00457100 [Aphelenchoides bicaudatus]|nr:hypothetical protein M3Y97_00457100 [Aphelenchoides bicaudatus]